MSQSPTRPAAAGDDWRTAVIPSATMSQSPARPAAAGGDLLPQHQQLIDDSAIAPAVAAARGYRSVSARVDLERLGFSEAQRRVPALLIPVWGVAGEIAAYQARPDAPRIAGGKPLKYETPRGSRMALDVPPAARPWLGDPARPLFVTEGARKADSAVSQGLCCVALLGVWNWRGSNAAGGTTALPDWESVALAERTVYVVFDSDVMEKAGVRAALTRLVAFLAARRAQARPVYLPPGPGGGKQGLDDFFAAGGTVAGLLGYAEATVRATPAESEANRPYAVREGRICRRGRDGEGWLPLCSFTAEIVEEIVADDGASERAELTIAGALASGERLPLARVPTQRFPSLDWVAPQWGVAAVVHAGMGAKDHLRAAIQTLSANVARRRIYEHPGWRRIEPHGWVYLHAGGGIGPAGSIGPLDGVETRLRGAVGRVRLPEPPAGDDRRAAFAAALGLLDLAPDRITVPLFGAVWRAVLHEIAPADCSVFLAGGTGRFKSELAALAMQHFGAGFDRLCLPANWASTANALERVGFDFKDALCVIDDFAPQGSPLDVARLHASADRVLRGAGNAAGRGRLNADGSPRAEYAPRGLLLATGEDLPRGHSLRARLAAIEVGPGEVDTARLSDAQRQAAAGTFAAALAAYLRWLAPQLDELPARAAADLTALRAAAAGGAGDAHARTPDLVAHLAYGWRVFLRGATAAGALDRAAAEALAARIWVALGEMAAAQAAHLHTEEPTRRFLDLLAAAIQSGAAHVAALAGDEPPNPAAWGWRRVSVGSGDAERNDWRAQGPAVGWLAGDDLFLNLPAALAAIRRTGDGGGVPLSEKTLAKRLHERGLLRATEQAGRLSVRVSVAGERVRAHQLAAAALLDGESAQAAHAGRSAPHTTPASGNAEPVGPILGTDYWTGGAESVQESGQNLASPCGSGPIGPIGPIFPTPDPGSTREADAPPADTDADHWAGWEEIGA